MTTAPRSAPLDVLIIGTGVIGTVYGAWLAMAGHRVSSLARYSGPAGTRLLTIEDATRRTRQSVNVAISTQPGAMRWDLVIVAVRADQLDSTVGTLTSLVGAPSILVLGNNPLGRRALPPELPGTVILGFPGIGGISVPSEPPAGAPSTSAGLVRFVIVDQQPTTVGLWTGLAADAFFAALHHAGASTARTDDMPGWLAHHTIFISCMSMALSRRGNSATSLALDRAPVLDMCRSIEEGFRSLRVQRIGGIPRNLAILHLPVLRWIAVRYWTTLLRSDRGELYFAAHCRSAPDEVRSLAGSAIRFARAGHTPIPHLLALLRAQP